MEEVRIYARREIAAAIKKYREDGDLEDAFSQAVFRVAGYTKRSVFGEAQKRMEIARATELHKVIFPEEE